MTKLTPRQRDALLLIQANPDTMAWPGTFADAFWPRDFIGERGGRLHGQRNKKNAPMASWWAAGYLGRLRKSGLVRGGYYERRPGGSYGRGPLLLTDLAKKLLENA